MSVPDANSVAEKITSLEEQVAEISAQRDQYKKLYLDMLELCRKLERGILGQKREKLPRAEEQLTLQVLSMMLGQQAPEPPPEVEQVRAHERTKPTGRKPLPDKLPRVDIEVIPPDVQHKGLDAFEKIGEDVTETVERRPGSLVVVRTHKPKFVPKDRDRNAPTTVLQSPPLELPIERGLAGPGFLADTVVKRWQDHMPLYRLERIYGREGLELARSTICGWHSELGRLVQAGGGCDVGRRADCAVPVHGRHGGAGAGDGEVPDGALLRGGRAGAARAVRLRAEARIGARWTSCSLGTGATWWPMPTRSTTTCSRTAG